MEIRSNRWFKVDEVHPDVRDYHSRIVLLEGCQIQCAYRGYVQEAFEVGDGMTMSVSPLLSLILQIPGVVSAELKAYSLRIQRNPVYAWDELEKSIMQLWYGIKVATEMELHAAEGERMIKEGAR